MRFASLLAIVVSVFTIIGCAPKPYQKTLEEGVSYLKNFDYALDLRPSIGNIKELSYFKGKRISIYYLSPRCPHCKTALPYIFEARKELESLGYESLNICIKYSSDEDFEGFVNELNVNGVNFKDENRAFSKKYGTGSVPVFFVINDSGEIIRYNKVTDSLAVQVKRDLACCKDI
jgi:thiol-disulfide isomerase/thioredoxin